MPQKTILIGDDDKDIADIYKIAFEKAGFRVISAFDGQEVIRIAKEERPDVLLLDINMPIKDGFEVLRTVARDEILYRALKKSPIIMISNYSNPQDIDFCMKHGAQDFIIKAEWDPASVVKRVEKRLNIEG